MPVSSVFGRAGNVIATLGDYTDTLIANTSSVAGDTVKDALNTLGIGLANLASALVTLSNATPQQLGVASPGDATTAARSNHIHPSTFTNVGTNNVSFDLLPTSQTKGTVNTGSNVTVDIAINVSRRYTIQANVWVDDGVGDCIYTKSFVIQAHRKASGDPIVVTRSIIDDAFSTAGFTLLDSVPVGAGVIRFTLANASGANRNYNLNIGHVSCDKP